jgi:hypothetical protein
VDKVKQAGPDGVVSLLVPDDDRMGQAALVVVLDEDSALRNQTPTVVGG